jgi:hypothetical protein
MAVIGACKHAPYTYCGLSREAISNQSIRAWMLTTMPDYYTSDVTQMPYSVIFSGGGKGWPLGIRLMVAFRKVVHWHYKATYARCAPERWCRVDVGNLPVSAREGLQVAITEIEQHGFRLYGTVRADTIASQVSYSSVLISEDRAAVCTAVALRMRLGAISRSVFATGLRSDLADGTILITWRGPKLPAHMIRPHQKIETLPESTDGVDLVRRHYDRLRCLPAQQIVLVPSDRVDDYLLERTRRDWEDFMATGMFRKLSAREVARLRAIQFDFE